VTDENENIEAEPTPEASSDALAGASASESASDAASEEVTPVASETSNEEVAESSEVEPVAAEEAAPVAEEAAPAAEEAAPAAEEAAPAAPAAEEAAPAAAEPVAPVTPATSGGEPQAVDPTQIVEGDVDYIEEDVEPRVKPAIPGADLIPDIVSDGNEFLDAEARAAAEAEAEEAAARAAAEDDGTASAQPIAEVTINLAAGARYTATGKRKTGVARVILKPGTGTYTINGKTLESFFPRETLQRVIRQPLEAVGYEARMDVVARMHGGGVSSQAGALRHGISRALLEADPNLRGELKRRGFLTRDPRVKERKKAGLKKARKRPQFSKR
jgi:small subunit ribosomal protein S9